MREAHLSFCTLFNGSYLSRGMVMYESLKKYRSNFTLYILAFDDQCYDALLKLNKDNIIPVKLEDFEDESLLQVKKSRSDTEYFWTCTSSWILYCIEKFELSMCTYLDADLYFYADPKVLLDEMGNTSVLITEHRYTPEYDQTATSGKYCVQFMVFKNDDKGQKVLNWWRKACLDWCYLRFESGKYGDQKYLDSWTAQFEGVHELRHLGGGLAPWNVQQYNFHKTDVTITAIQRSSNSTFTPVFFHFQGFRLYRNNVVQFAMNYELPESVKSLLYEPYAEDLIKWGHDNPFDFDPHGFKEHAPYLPIGKALLLRTWLKGIFVATKNLLFAVCGMSTKQTLDKHHLYKINLANGKVT